MVFPPTFRHQNRLFEIWQEIMNHTFKVFFTVQLNYMCILADSVNISSCAALCLKIRKFGKYTDE